MKYLGSTPSTPDRNHGHTCAQRFGLAQPLRGCALKCTAPVLGTLVPCSPGI